MTQDPDELAEKCPNPSVHKVVCKLEAMLPDLEAQRQSSALANDMYEAADDWRIAGNFIINADTRVDYQARAFSERCLLAALQASLLTRPTEEQKRYAGLWKLGDEIVMALQSTPSPKDGHLGVLRILRDQFRFIEQDYGFYVTSEKPTGLRYSSGQVFLELEYASTADLSCAFGSERQPEHRFWIENLLYIDQDKRYKSIAGALSLNTTDEVEAWFRFVAGIFQERGRHVLLNEPGIFDRLKAAQSERDREIDREMSSR
jgi:hypothetical protein